MTFSLTVCLLIVSLGILAGVGQEQRSAAQEKLLLKHESLGMPSCRVLEETKRLCKNLLLRP